MKVENLTIQRVNVTLSCGCGVACDFKDPLCKDPFKPDVVLPTDPPGGPAAMKEFSICKKHKDDSQRSMLEFMMAERMDEAIEDAQRPALHAAHATDIPVKQEGLEGGNVSRVATITGGGHRPQHPLGVKTLTRLPEALVKAGAVATHAGKETEVEPGMDSVESLDRLLAEPGPTAP